MELDKQFLEMLHKNTELAGELMEQASVLKMNVDTLEAEKKQLEQEKNDLAQLRKHNDKLMRHRLLSQWELRVRFAHSSFLMFHAIHKHSNGWLYTVDGEGPFMSANQSKKSLLPESEWVVIWRKVEQLVRARYDMLKARVKELDNKSIPTYGIIPETVENTDDAFRIGDTIWAAFNTDKDDGQGGIKQDANGRYIYTWEAAKRIADSIPGWHIPNDKDFKALCKSLGGEQQTWAVNSCINKVFGSYTCLWSASEYTSTKYHGCWHIDASHTIRADYSIPENYHHLRLVKDAPDVEKV